MAGPTQEAAPNTAVQGKQIDIHIEQPPPPDSWAVEILSAIVVAIVSGGIIAMWRRKK